MTEIITFISITYLVDCQMQYILSFLLKMVNVTVWSMTMECKGLSTIDDLDLTPKTVATVTDKRHPEERCQE
jgi:hypothetical protein